MEGVDGTVLSSYTLSKSIEKRQLMNMITIPYSKISMDHDYYLPYLVTKFGKVVCEVHTKDCDEYGRTINYQALCPNTGAVIDPWLSLNELKRKIKNDEIKPC